MNKLKNISFLVAILFLVGISRSMLVFAPEEASELFSNQPDQPTPKLTPSSLEQFRRAIKPETFRSKETTPSSTTSTKTSIQKSLNIKSTPGSQNFAVKIANKFKIAQRWAITELVKESLDQNLNTSPLEDQKVQESIKQLSRTGRIRLFNDITSYEIQKTLLQRTKSSFSLNQTSQQIAHDIYLKNVNLFKTLIPEHEILMPIQDKSGSQSTFQFEIVDISNYNPNATINENASTFKKQQNLKLNTQELAHYIRMNFLEFPTKNNLISLIFDTLATSQINLIEDRTIQEQIANLTRTERQSLLTQITLQEIKLKNTDFSDNDMRNTFITNAKFYQRFLPTNELIIAIEDASRMKRSTFQLEILDISYVADDLKALDQENPDAARLQQIAQKLKTKLSLKLNVPDIANALKNYLSIAHEQEQEDENQHENVSIGDEEDKDDESTSDKQDFISLSTRPSSIVAEDEPEETPEEIYASLKELKAIENPEIFKHLLVVYNRKLTPEQYQDLSRNESEEPLSQDTESLLSAQEEKMSDDELTNIIIAKLITDTSAVSTLTPHNVSASGFMYYIENYIMTHMDTWNDITQQRNLRTFIQQHLNNAHFYTHEEWLLISKSPDAADTIDDAIFKELDNQYQSGKLLLKSTQRKIQTMDNTSEITRILYEKKSIDHFNDLLQHADHTTQKLNSMLSQEFLEKYYDATTQIWNDPTKEIIKEIKNIMQNNWSHYNSDLQDHLAETIFKELFEKYFNDMQEIIETQAKINKGNQEAQAYDKQKQEQDLKIEQIYKIIDQYEKELTEKQLEHDKDPIEFRFGIASRVDYLDDIHNMKQANNENINEYIGQILDKEFSDFKNYDQAIQDFIIDNLKQSKLFEKYNRDETQRIEDEK